MRRKIDVADLKVGMHIVDTGLSWFENPYLYAKSCVIEDQSQIEAILAEGYTETFIDDPTDGDGSGLSLHHTVETISKALDLSKAQQHTQFIKTKKVPLEKELGIAKKLYSDSMRLVQDCVKDARMGVQLDVSRSNELVQGLMESVIRNSDALISITKLRSYDEYTYTHSINVSVLTLGFANFLQLPPPVVKDLGVAALLHDMGKARIPDAILNKPGKLTQEEFSEMMKHPTKGVELLAGQRNVSEEILRGIEEHHEKYNGKGYPKGLQADAISLFGSIISLADIYDALTSKRVYKPGIQPNKAMGTIFSMRGQDLFPLHVENFVNFLGIYPIGSMVELSSGMFALVASPNPGNPLRPNVKVIFDAQKRACIPQDIDLSAHKGKEDLKVVKTFDPKDFRVDPAQYLL